MAHHVKVAEQQTPSFGYMTDLNKYLETLPDLPEAYIRIIDAPHDRSTMREWREWSCKITTYYRQPTS